MKPTKEGGLNSAMNRLESFRNFHELSGRRVININVPRFLDDKSEEYERLLKEIGPLAPFTQAVSRIPSLLGFEAGFEQLRQGLELCIVMVANDDEETFLQTEDDKEGLEVELFRDYFLETNVYWLFNDNFEGALAEDPYSNVDFNYHPSLPVLRVKFINPALIDTSSRDLIP